MKKVMVKRAAGEKTYWNEIGRIFETRKGGEMLVLHMWPDQAFYVFEDDGERRERDNTKPTQASDNVPF